MINQHSTACAFPHKTWSMSETKGEKVNFTKSPCESTEFWQVPRYFKVNQVVILLLVLALFMQYSIHKMIMEQGNLEPNHECCQHKLHLLNGFYFFLWEGGNCDLSYHWGKSQRQVLQLSPTVQRHAHLLECKTKLPVGVIVRALFVSGDPISDIDGCYISLTDYQQRFKKKKAN